MDRSFRIGGWETMPRRCRAVEFVTSLLLLATGCGSEEPTAPVYEPIEIPRPVDGEPTWSPDGSRLAYHRYAQTIQELDSLGDDQIWIYTLATGERSYLTTGRTPSWSPLGDALAVIRGDGLYRVSVNGTSEARLTDFGSYFPTWSPDGQRIAFDTGHNDPRGANAIWIINSDGTGLTDI